MDVRCDDLWFSGIGDVGFTENSSCSQGGSRVGWMIGGRTPSYQRGCGNDMFLLELQKLSEFCFCFRTARSGLRRRRKCPRRPGGLSISWERVGTYSVPGSLGVQGPRLR